MPILEDQELKFSCPSTKVGNSSKKHQESSKYLNNAVTPPPIESSICCT